MVKNLFTFNFKKPKACFAAFFVILGLTIFQAVLPLNSFTFRGWETLIIKNSFLLIPGAFYPNMDFSMLEQGDLGYYSSDAEFRNCVWHIDKYGYRKENNFNEKYDIVLVGDSFVVGTGLGQDQILSEVLGKKINKSIYPLAPATLEDLFNQQRFIDNPPKTVIFVRVERSLFGLTKIGNLPQANIYNDLSTTSKTILLGRKIRRFCYAHSKPLVLIDSISKNSLLRYCIRQSQNYIRNHIEHLLLAAMTKPITDKNPKQMLFLQGTEALVQRSDIEVEKIAQTIKEYNLFFADKNIRFIFVTMPNKETIYYDYFPNQTRPDFLLRLENRLKAEGVEIINPQLSFENLFRKENKFAYFFDDTHWNSNGVEVVAKMLAEKLKN